MILHTVKKTDLILFKLCTHIQNLISLQKENRLFENDIVCDSPIRRATYSKIQESSPKRLYRVEESYRDKSLSPLRDKNEDVSKF